ncbi:methyltransferase domain-containing protein [Candidatus Poribacteria bacterium]|nr:methyltransferase domain-containing protein [Candidatus Poribacteria bacterium]
MSATPELREDIRDYYGRVLSSRRDLQTSACCSADGLPDHAREAAREIPAEVIERFYGCGSPIPPAVEGRTVLDLGCGTGRDVFICSKLVGPQGRVVGVDMTEEQLEVARRHEHTVAERFGYARPNTEFLQGYIEDLATLGIQDESVDVVVSNCVINLSPRKERLFAEILRVLRPGGELLFSDVFADRRSPAHLLQDPVLVGECLAGAMYFEDFRRLLARLGIPDIRVVSSKPITMDNREIERKVGAIRHHSITVRAFKLFSLEDRCEDYGQVAAYAGTIEGAPFRFRLDDHHEFESHRPMLVCGNTAAMLQETRLARHFHVTGDRSRHFGLIPCAPAAQPAVSANGGCC